MGEFVLNIEKYVDDRITSLVGRDNGRALLVKIQSKENRSLEEIEKKSSIIKVVISDRFMTMNRSYFLGAFAGRVIELGSEESFLSKYSFDASEHIKEKISDHIIYALKKASQKDILDV